MSRDPRLYLEDMRDCCRKVIRYCAGMTMDDPIADDKTFDAVMRNLEVSGCFGLLWAFAEKHAEVREEVLAALGVGA